MKVDLKWSLWNDNSFKGNLGLGFMNERQVSFWYFKNNHVEGYKKSVLNYLKGNVQNFEKEGSFQLIVDFYNCNKRENPDPTGHLYVRDLEDKENKFESFCEYVLSKDRRFIPVEVSCRNKKDYGMIERILKENYGDKGKLTNGLLGIGFLGNVKSIKGRTVKELSFGNYVQR